METVLLIVSTRPHELCAHQLRGFHPTILVRDIVSSTDHCARPDVVPAHARAVRSENRFLGIPRVSLACSPCLGVVVAAEIPWDRHIACRQPRQDPKNNGRARARSAHKMRAMVQLVSQSCYPENARILSFFAQIDQASSYGVKLTQNSRSSAQIPPTSDRFKLSGLTSTPHKFPNQVPHV